MNRAYVVLLTLLTLTALAAAQVSWPIAVNELTGKGIPQEQADILSDRLRGELVKTGHFSVMEREQMKEILKEQGFQQSGACTDQSCIVSMGQLLGVEYMITGTVGQVGKLMTMSTKVIGVATGEILMTVNEDCECSIEEVMNTSTLNLVRKLDKAMLSIKYATLSIETTPSGATVSLDGRMVGETPFSTGALPEGDYHLQIIKDGYVTAADSFNAGKGKVVLRSYKLEMTQQLKAALKARARADSLKAAVVQDSIRAVARKQKLRKKLVRSIVFGVIGSSFGATGMVMNTQAHKAIGEKKTLVDEYQSATIVFETYKTQIKAKEDIIKQDLVIRNILYGCAGAMGFALVISLPF